MSISMSAGTLDQDTSLDTTLEHLVYTLALLLAHPQAASLAPPFEQQLAQWWAIDRAEMEHWIEILKAAARIVDADNRLDALVDKLSNTLLIKTKGSREADEYRYFFEAKPPAAVKRPVLGGQVDTMDKWAATLAGSSDPDLAAIGVEMQAAVTYARAQEKALAAVEETNKNFRKLGDRKAFMDGLNALRKTTWGALAEMPHAQPDLKLPSGFADLFFKPVRKPRASEGPKTAADMQAVVVDLEEQLDAARAQLAALEAEEAAKAQAKAQREADEAELAEAERDLKAAQAKTTALRAKLGK